MPQAGSGAALAAAPASARATGGRSGTASRRWPSFFSSRISRPDRSCPCAPCDILASGTSATTQRGPSRPCMGRAKYSTCWAVAKLREAALMCRRCTEDTAAAARKSGGRAKSCCTPPEPEAACTRPCTSSTARRPISRLSREISESMRLSLCASAVGCRLSKSCTPESSRSMESRLRLSEASTSERMCSAICSLLRRAVARMFQSNPAAAATSTATKAAASSQT